MDQAINIVNLLNAAVPGIANLILLIKEKDGSVSVVQILDRADAQFNENMRKYAEWKAK